MREIAHIRKEKETIEEKCKEFAGNLKILSGDLDKEKLKNIRLQKELDYMSSQMKSDSTL